MGQNEGGVMVQFGPLRGELPALVAHPLHCLYGSLVKRGGCWL